MRSYYSYRPRSGSRIAAAHATQWTAICHVQSGTICAGDIVTVTLSTAKPGNHFRWAACRLAEELLPQIGGMAEDCGGIVTYCITRHDLPVLLAMIDRLLPQMHSQWPAVWESLWQQGAARIAAAARPNVMPALWRDWQPTYELVAAAPVPLMLLPGWVKRTVRDAEGRTTEEVETVPAIYVVDNRVILSSQYTLPFRQVAETIELVVPLPITDRGRIVTGSLGGDEHTSPDHPVGWLQIEGPAVYEALAIIGQPMLLNGVDDLIEVPVPQMPSVSLVGGDGESQPYIQATRACDTRPYWERLLPLASQHNYTVHHPSWAGWRDSA